MGPPADVDKAADEVVAARGCTPAEVTPYQVARHMACEPNGALYAKVRDWRRRWQDATGLAPIDVPAGAEAGFRAMLEQLTAQAIDHFVRTVRMVGGDLDRAAAMRVADAERRRVEAESETAEVLDLCQKAEVELAVATAKIGALEDALAQAQRREDVLHGRLGQREADALKSGAITAPGEIAAVAGAGAPPHGDVVDVAKHTQQAMPFHEPDGASE
ncbi:hypothetical protein [uncultured Sphingomonas sp.]|uniref:hypothetical protein n=1 Tax=uncultured Sphingomonas sp. TaxID=158754 RepID=UPI0025F99915|nr:hypothetical protein [uncultured Sphingomonas sp.]